MYDRYFPGPHFASILCLCFLLLYRAKIRMAEAVVDHRFQEIFPLPPPGGLQPNIAESALYSGSTFRGHQRSKGTSYEVEVRFG